MNDKYVVYKHTSPTGKIYIGITKQALAKRWKRGLGYVGNARFYNAIIKYGWDNFAHEIVAESISKDEAEKLEVALIEKYDSTHRSKGYNLKPGGSATAPTEETKRKISQAVKQMWQNPEKREDMRLSMRNRKRSKKARENISAAQRQRFEDPTERIKISERQKGGTRSAQTKIKTSESLKAYYANPDNKAKFYEAHAGINRKYHAKRVKCLETNEVFDAVIDAEHKYNIDHRNIIAVCKGKRKRAGGYTWQYA